MKRLLALLLALLCLASLTGCRTREERQEMRRQLDYASGKTPIAERDYCLDDGTVLAEQVVYEKNGVTITALGIYENDYAYCIPLRVRNESGSDIYCGMTGGCSVDRWAADGYFYLNVVSGGMADEELTLYKDGLRYLDGMTLHEITGTLYYYSEDDYEDITIPLTFDLGNGGIAEEDTPGTVLAEGDGFTFRYLECVQESWSVQYLFCLENTGDRTIEVEIENNEVTVNGREEESLWFYDFVQVPAGTLALGTLELGSYELESLNIYHVEEIERLNFTLSLSYYDSWSEQTVPVELRLDTAAE